MNETIGNKLKQTIGEIVDISLNRDATQRKPYAVYSLDVAPSYDKAGVYKYSGTLEITIYTSTFAEGETMATQILAAINRSMQNQEYRTLIISKTSTSNNGTFIQSIEYNIAQYRNS